jgi:hypothetical protein
MHIDPDSHAAWAFNNRRDGGSRHYQMLDPSWSIESHGWIQSQKMSEMLIDERCNLDRFWAALEVVDASAVGFFHLITKHLDAMEVPLSKLFTYASDGASVVASKLGGLAGTACAAPPQPPGRVAEVPSK